MTNARVSRVAVEALSTEPDPSARISRLGVEVLHTIGSEGESQMAREAVVVSHHFPSGDTPAAMAREAVVVSHTFPEAHTAARLGRLSMTLAMSRPHGWYVFDDPLGRQDPLGSGGAGTGGGGTGGGSGGGGTGGGGSGDTIAPAIPASLSATDDPSGDTPSIFLNWTSNVEGDFASYKVYRAASPSGPFVLQVTITAIGTSQYLDEGLTADIPYYYAVTAVDVSGNESGFGYANTTPTTPITPPPPGDTIAPAMPSGLQATPAVTSVALDWGSNTETDFASYRIFRALSATGGYVLVGTVPNIVASQFTVTGLAENTAYWFGVSAIDASGNESGLALSGRVVTLGGDPVPTGTPSAVTGLVATSGNGSVLLNWNDNPEVGIEGYKVFQSSSASGPWTLIATVEVSQYLVTGLTNGVTYYFAVTAVGAGGGRDPLLWPYPSSSIWNMPIGASASFQPLNGDAPTNHFAFRWEEDILVFSPASPERTIKEHDAGWSGADRCASRTGDDLTGNGTVSDVTQPIPTGWDTTGYLGTTPNHSAAIVYREGSDLRLFETQPFHICSDEVPISQFVNSDWVGDSIVTGGNGTKGGSHGGAYMTAFGGTIRLGEWVPGGAITHATKVIVNTNKWCADQATQDACFRWPALRADSGAVSGYGSQAWSGLPTGAKMGMLVSLPASFDVETLQTEPARILGRSIRDYGSYLVDGDAGLDVFMWAVEWSHEGRVIDEFESEWGIKGFHRPVDGAMPALQVDFLEDMRAIEEALCLVNDNSSSNVGGAGVRRAPLAPAIGGVLESAKVYSGGVVPSVSDPAPPVPTNLQATAGDGSVSLTWTGVVAADFSHYNVYRSTSSGGVYTQIATRTLTNYTDTGRTNGTPYYYKVSAEDTATNESALTAFVTATPVGVTPPVGLPSPDVIFNSGNLYTPAKVTAEPSGTVFQFTTTGGTGSGPRYENAAIPVLANNRYRFDAGTVLDGNNTIPLAFTGTAGGVYIYDCEWTAYVGQNSAGNNNVKGGGAIRLRSGWQLIRPNGHHNKYTAVRFDGPNADIIEGKLVYNGEFGFSGTGSGGAVTDTEVAYNGGGANLGLGGDQGGCKIVHSVGFTFLRVHAHHNFGSGGSTAIGGQGGNGLWSDINNDNHVFDTCNIHDNQGAGIFYEVSLRFDIKNSTFTNNGRDYNATSGGIWPVSSQVQISNSGGGSSPGNAIGTYSSYIRNNTMTCNGAVTGLGFYGITLFNSGHLQWYNQKISNGCLGTRNILIEGNTMNFSGTKWKSVMALTGNLPGTTPDVRSADQLCGQLPITAAASNIAFRNNVEVMSGGFYPGFPYIRSGSRVSANQWLGFGYT